MDFFPDSGEWTCLAGPTYLHKLNLNTSQLIPSQNTIAVVVGHKLNVMDGYQSSLPLVLIPPINLFTYVIKWIKFISAERTALKQKSYHHLSHIPCLKPLHWRLQPYQLSRHHPPDYLNSYILPHSKTY